MARFTAARLEAESRSKRRDPFEYESADGRVVVFRDPKALHYRQLRKLGTGSIEETMQTLLGEDYDTFCEFEEVDGYLMEALFAAYGEHYGVSEQTAGE